MALAIGPAFAETKPNLRGGEAQTHEAADKELAEMRTHLADQTTWEKRDVRQSGSH